MAANPGLATDRAATTIAAREPYSENKCLEGTYSDFFFQIFAYDYKTQPKLILANQNYGSLCA